MPCITGTSMSISQTNTRRSSDLESSGKGEPYDKKDRESIFRYAARLSGHTLAETREIEIDTVDPVRSKGYFGQKLETAYFKLRNNNSPLPDFPEAGLELKSTPMKKSSKGLVSKERLVLNIIDYMAVRERGSWEEAFAKKNSDLLIVFYIYEKGEAYYDLKVAKVVNWKFTGDDLRIIKDDWSVIESYILDGRAHELSEGLTNYLTACTKGSTKEKSMRRQPFSDKDAMQRALSLKSSYVNKIFRESIDLHYELESIVHETKNVGEPIFKNGWDENMTMDEAILSRTKAFRGMTCRDIESVVGEVNPSSKSYYATLCVRIFGVHGKHVREFEDAGIVMKTVRLTKGGKPKESMSFPYFEYNEIVNQTWEGSDFYAQLDRKFFIPVFQMTDEDRDKRRARFLGAFFWSIPYADMEEARKVWEATRSLIASGDYEHFPGMKDNRVSHVRPHGRNNSDTIGGPDGLQHIKRCFWLNARYLNGIIRSNLGIS